MAGWDVGILDFGTRPSQESPIGEVLRGIVDYAQHAEALGYRRFWIAEHHTPYAAESSPEIVALLVASQTATIRVGTGGILLPYYSPVKVAATFRLLEALHPGRIDLGVGRGPGVMTPAQAEALVWGSAEQLEPQRFAEKVKGLAQAFQGAFPPGHRFAGAQAFPADVPAPELWMLSTGAHSMQAAAENGMALSFGHFLHRKDPPPVEDMARLVRESYASRFRPRPGGPAAPRVSVAVSVYCAADEETARREHGKLVARGNPPSGLVGDPRQVREGLERIAGALGTREVMLCTSEYVRARRKEMYALLAEELGLARPQASGAAGDARAPA